MEAKVAVMTVSGKAYYLIVNELKRRNVPFVSLALNEAIPVGVKAVITTEHERHLVDHGKVLALEDGGDVRTLVNHALRIAEGKCSYEKVVIGVDPGKVFGLVVLADGKVIETINCFSVEETLNRISNVLRDLGAFAASISVKVGNGIPRYKERLLQALDKLLPLNVKLESVSEAGTDRCAETKRRRGLRDITSAIKIAGRNGRVFTRSVGADEQNS